MRYLPVSATPSAQHPDSMLEDVQGSAGGSRSRTRFATGVKSTLSGHQHSQIFCAALHLSLVVAHAVLLVVYVYHFEHAVAFNIDSFSTNWLPFIVTAASQAVGTAYLAVLVVFTQRLALRSDIFTRQTLTAIHDKNAAWLGLGSAFGSLRDQLKLPAAVYGVASITLYLVGVFALHITIPSMFHVVPFNATTAASHPTVLANGPIAQHTPVSVNYDHLATSSTEGFSGLGLLDNMVYDVVPEVPGAAGHTVVNASIFDVHCESMLPSRIAPPDTGGYSKGDTTTGSVLVGDLGGFEVPLPPYPAVTIGSVTRNSVCTNVYEACWTPIIVSSTVPVVDDSGAMGPESNISSYWTPLWPAVQQSWHTDLLGLDLPPLTVIQGHQLLQCSLQITDVKINVSAESRTPTSAVAPPYTPASSWSNLTQTQLWPTDQHVSHDVRVYLMLGASSGSPPAMHDPYPSQDWILSAVNATITSSSVPSVTAATVANTTFRLDDDDMLASMGFDTYAPTAFDEFIMEDLGVVPVTNTSNMRVALADLNLSIGKALAAVYWSSNNLNFTGPYSVPVGRFNDSQLEYSTSTSGEALITVSTTRVRLNLTLVPIIVGLTVSALLFGLSLILTRARRSDPSLHSADTRSAIDSAGILQLTWLLGNEVHLNRARDPTSQVLREAGMFDVEMSERARDKIHRVATGMGKEDASLSGELC